LIWFGSRARENGINVFSKGFLAVEPDDLYIISYTKYLFFPSLIEEQDMETL